MRSAQESRSPVIELVLEDKKIEEIVLGSKSGREALIRLNIALLTELMGRRLAPQERTRISDRTTDLCDHFTIKRNT